MVAEGYYVKRKLTDMDRCLAGCTTNDSDEAVAQLLDLFEQFQDSLMACGFLPPVDLSSSSSAARCHALMTEIADLI